MNNSNNIFNNITEKQIEEMGEFGKEVAEETVAALNSDKLPAKPPKLK